MFETAELGQRVSKDTYTKKEPTLRIALLDSQCRLTELPFPVIVLIGGVEGAGKGEVVNELNRWFDTRGLQTQAFWHESDEERAQHYLWRFWRQLPRAGYCTIYDRSWYGRVLVERIKNFCSHREWSRAYREINDFERQLSNDGTVIVKFWLHISAEEQLRRFEEREKIPWKNHKITAEDWRNRDRWNDDERAVNEMVTRTITTIAPWTLVSANDKRYARIQVLETFCARLEAALV